MACKNIDAFFRGVKVPREYKSARFVPLCKGYWDHLEFANNMGISLLSVVGEVYGIILIECIVVIKSQRTVWF